MYRRAAIADGWFPMVKKHGEEDMALMSRFNSRNGKPPVKAAVRRRSGSGGLSGNSREATREGGSAGYWRCRRAFGEPGLRIDLVQLGGLNERIHEGSAFASPLRSGEQPAIRARASPPYARSAALSVTQIRYSRRAFRGGPPEENEQRREYGRRPLSLSAQTQTQLVPRNDCPLGGA